MSDGYLRRDLIGRNGKILRDQLIGYVLREGRLPTLSTCPEKEDTHGDPVYLCDLHWGDGPRIGTWAFPPLSPEQIRALHKTGSVSYVCDVTKDWMTVVLLREMPAPTSDPKGGKP